MAVFPSTCFSQIPPMSFIRLYHLPLLFAQTLWILLSQLLASSFPLWRRLPESFSVRRRRTLWASIFTLWARIFALRARIFILSARIFAADFSWTRALHWCSNQPSLRLMSGKIAVFTFVLLPRTFSATGICPSILTRGEFRACSRDPLGYIAQVPWPYLSSHFQKCKGMRGYNCKKCLFHFHTYFNWASEATQ